MAPESDGLDEETRVCFFGGKGVVCFRMIPEFYDFLRDIWESKPSMIVLFVGGIVVLFLLVIDTHRHRKHRKERHRIKHFH